MSHELEMKFDGGMLKSHKEIYIKMFEKTEIITDEWISGFTVETS